MYERHKDSSSRLYQVWATMKSRCNNPNTLAYKNYGGRGISVCKEWTNSYKEFMEWANSHGYKHRLTIERIDNNGNYEPLNCKWASMSEQLLNKRPQKVFRISPVISEGLYEAKIQINKKRNFLGRYATQEECVVALNDYCEYNMIERIYFLKETI